MKPERRTLDFGSLDQVMPDVDRLLEGHSTIGNWSLGQICNHLATAITGSVEGYPMRAPWIVRKTIGPWVVGRILTTGRFPAWIRLPEKYVPKPGVDARAEAEALRAALRLFASHAGPLAEHPLCGVSREVWDSLHCIHCAHHLSFAIPSGAG